MADEPPRRYPNSRRSTIFLGAIVHIQLFWRSKLALIRARQERERERAEQEAFEHEAFGSFAPTRRPTRTKEDLETLRGNRVIVDRSASSPGKPLPHQPNRYHARDSSGEDLTSGSLVTTPHAVAVEPRPTVHVPSSVAHAIDGPSASPSSPLQKKKHPEGMAAVLTVQDAANIIKYFIRARVLLWRLREKRRAREMTFLEWETSAFRTCGVSSAPRRQPRELPPRGSAKEASSTSRQQQQQVAPLQSKEEFVATLPPPQPLPSGSGQSPRSKELESLLEKLVSLKDEVEGATRSIIDLDKEFSTLQRNLRTMLEHQHDAQKNNESTTNDNTTTTSGSHETDEAAAAGSRFELFADTATDLCVDIQALIDASPPAASHHHQEDETAGTSATSASQQQQQEMTLDEVADNIRASEGRQDDPEGTQPTVVIVAGEVNELPSQATSDPCAEQTQEVNSALREQQRREYEQQQLTEQQDAMALEEASRRELVDRGHGQRAILVDSFFDGALSWLITAEQDARNSTVNRTEGAARKVIRDVRDMTEAHLRARHRAALAIQCWVRVARARRMLTIKSQRSKRVMLLRIAKEDELEREVVLDEGPTNAVKFIGSVAPLDGGVSGHGGPAEATPSSAASRRNIAEEALNASMSVTLNSLQKSVAATTIQRIARGRRARVLVKQKLAQILGFLEASEVSHEALRDSAATTVSSFFRSLAAQRLLKKQQEAVAKLLEQNAAAEALHQDADTPRAAQNDHAQQQVATDVVDVLATSGHLRELLAQRQTQAATIISSFFRSLAAQRMRVQKQQAVSALLEHYAQLEEDDRSASNGNHDEPQRNPPDVVSAEGPQATPPPSEAAPLPVRAPSIPAPPPPQQEPTAGRPVRRQYQTQQVPAPVEDEHKRPMSARVPSSMRPLSQSALRRPTTASPRKKATAEGGLTPYVDGCHDSKTALRTLSESPLFTLPANARAQPLHGRLVTGQLASSPNDVVEVEDDDDVDEKLISPVKWGGNDFPAAAKTKALSQQQHSGASSSEYSKPPALPPLTARPPHQSIKEPEYLNYVGMLEVLKQSIMAGLLPAAQPVAGADVEQQQEAQRHRNPTMIHGDLLDIVLARRGTSAMGLSSTASATTAAAKRQSLTILELDAALVRSPVASGNNPLEIRHTGELSDLWKSDVFIDRVVQRLHLLAAPNSDTLISSYCFCLDDIAIAILSSIDTIAVGPQQQQEPSTIFGAREGAAPLPPFVAKTQLINGVPGMMVYQGQPVADREEFEIFCGVFVSTCKLLAEERRTVDAATIASCFTILDVHRRRMLPRKLFDAAFKPRIPLGAHHKGGVPFLAFASSLRRNMIHSPMTCQKLMGAFYEKELLGGKTSALEKRLEVICRAEENLRSLAADLLDALSTVGERAGASLGDSLVLYTALSSSSTASQIRWFALSFLATLYNQFSVQAMKGFASIPHLIRELMQSPEEFPSPLRRALSPTIASNSKMNIAPAARPVDAVWEDVIRVFSSLIESPMFSDTLRLQKQCDGSSGRRNVYRTRASNSEELDRCVPWSTLSLPCVDSLNYFAAQRVSFDSALTGKLQADAEGLILRSNQQASSGGNIESTSSDEKVTDDRQWLAPSGLSSSHRPATNHIRFFCSSASAHVDGFEARRSQWNSLLYSLRHYSICLTEVFALQFMDRSVAHLPPPTRRAVTQSDAQRQLLVAMATHPDLLQSFPLRVNGEAHHISESSSTKLFTNRFAKMLFTLSVQEKEQAGVRQAWETPIAERRQREYEHQQDYLDSTETTTPKPQLSADDAPLPIARPSSRALHQYAAAAGSPTHSRPSSAASNGSGGRTGSASSLHRNGSSNGGRPGAADLCSPPSRSSRATTTGQNLGGHGGTTPSTTSNFGASRISPPKRTTMMDQIMGSFRGIPQQQPPTNHHPAAAPGQQQRPPPPHGANLRPTATTTASTLPRLGTPNNTNSSVGGSPFSPERNVVKPQILLSQRVADLLSSASGQPVPAAMRSSGGAAPVSQGHRVGAGVYPMFRVPSTTPPTQSSR
ncbi:Hypothetical protein, putative [Bodo saltans]|uniref:Uncharacterized protein n=1 Tax=Bodo saltans TaxID=75058 RepID=A0A0S4JFN5_BODSA|nr:Hypothetical protein, putative [Bodo saltans]|eukprot:CUG88804.1 Hypothetical protein, putative [Bodo saltans]